MILRTTTAIALVGAFIILYFSGTANYFEVEKTVIINSGADRIFPLVAESIHWKKWSSLVNNSSVNVNIVSINLDKEVIANLQYVMGFKQKYRYTFELNRIDTNKTELKLVCKGDLNLVSKVLNRLFNINSLLAEQIKQEIDQIKILAEDKST